MVKKLFPFSLLKLAYLPSIKQEFTLLSAEYLRPCQTAHLAFISRLLLLQLCSETILGFLYLWQLLDHTCTATIAAP